MRRSILACIGIGAFLTATVAQATLTPVQRDHLRYRLENLWNEVDLTIRNHAQDERDLKKQEQEISILRMYRKIPLATAPRGHGADPFEVMRPRIEESARQFGLNPGAIQLIRQTRMSRPIPLHLYTDQPEFHLSQDQLVSRLQIELLLKGSQASFRGWMDSWRTITPARWASPYLEADRVEMLGSSSWKIRVTAYCFRDISFPKLSPREPRELLPGWARRHPSIFRKREPLLWSFIERAERELPDARPLYGPRERFLLNDARLTFFTKKLLSK